MRRFPFLTLLLVVTTLASAQTVPQVTTIRLPNNGYAPQCVVDSWNNIHLLYATGSPRKATLHYLCARELTETFEAQQTITDAALVTGSVRNPQLAIGDLRCPYFGWMVSPKEFMCTNLTQTNHLNDPTNIIASHPGIDAGAAITFAPNNTLFAVWHAPENPKDDKESSRKIWIAKSSEGRYDHFDKIASDIAPRGRGVCACCALAAFATNEHLYVLYRCATEQVHRDIHLLTFDEDLTCTEDQTLSTVTVNKCIMSTAAFAQSKEHVYTAFESDKNIFLHRLHSPSVNNDSITIPIPGNGDNRKHPALAINKDNTILLAWTEGTSFNKGGSIAWQLFTPDLQPLGERNTAPNLPPNSSPATVAKPDGSFVILY